jgi:hypothetical protein
MFSESIVNCTFAEALELACEMAVTVKVAGSVLFAVASVGTVFGATYKPVAESEPQTEPVVPQASCQVTAVLLVPVTLAVNCKVWKVSIFETSVLMDTVIGVLDPPPPPQAANLRAPATASMPAKRACFFIGLTFRTRCVNDDLCFQLRVFFGRTANRRNRTGEFFRLLRANPSSEFLMCN